MVTYVDWLVGVVAGMSLVVLGHSMLGFLNGMARTIVGMG